MSTNVPNAGVGFQDMDPQRIYNYEDSAFLGATIMRSLTAYPYSSDPLEATTVLADAATDTGRPNSDFTEWSFTLRDGMKWQDGSALKCEDFKYGASRTFANDIITDGAAYAIKFLAIPTDANGSSRYKGPYQGGGQDLFDQAVTCDGSTITYRLNRPVPDFNYTVTLGFAAVPNPIDHPGVDTGEGYDTAPWSDGPYIITNLTQGVGGNLTLDRNPNWDPATDTYRGAYPDKWVVNFGVNASELDQRLIASTGDDAFAVQYGTVEPDDVSDVFINPTTPLGGLATRAFSGLNGYASYVWIRTDKVPNQKIRQAVAVALDRSAIRLAGGGEYALDFADGVVVPTIGIDFAPTHLWDAAGPFGQSVATSGNTELARQLIAESGEAAPTLTYGYNAASKTSTAIADVVRSSLQAAGFLVELYYWPSYGIPEKDDFGMGAWGADWPNASTVIPTIFTDADKWNLPHVTQDAYPDFYADVDDALATSERTAQATKWQALNATAMENAFVVPLFYQREQHLAGSQVGGLYRWAPYASWPYAQLYSK